MHIREKQQFENYHFIAFFMLFYLKQPISLNLNKFEKNTPTEETLTWQALSIYFWEIEHEIRVFDWKKFTNEI